MDAFPPLLPPSRPLFGSYRGPSHFPLSIKFLDCNDRLSVQVHPEPRAGAAVDGGENGKTEARPILEVRPDSRVYAGLKPGVDLARSSAPHVGTVEECLHSFPARAGDCVFVPGGDRACARRGDTLGRNTAIQQCDIPAVRRGRVGPDGKPLRLCIAKSRSPASTSNAARSIRSSLALSRTGRHKSKSSCNPSIPRCAATRFRSRL